jgi:hypothetical protein
MSNKLILKSGRVKHPRTQAVVVDETEINYIFLERDFDEVMSHFKSVMAATYDGFIVELTFETLNDEDIQSDQYSL